jgi:hypothetical protein
VGQASGGKDMIMEARNPSPGNDLDDVDYGCGGGGGGGGGVAVG